MATKGFGANSIYPNARNEGDRLHLSGEATSQGNSASFPEGAGETTKFVPTPSAIALCWPEGAQIRQEQLAPRLALVKQVLEALGENRVFMFRTFAEDVQVWPLEDQFVGQPGEPCSRLKFSAFCIIPELSNTKA
jgi:hypothetical protein